MKYFRKRHNLRTDYSGFQEVSSLLREKIETVVCRYVGSYRGVSISGQTISVLELEHELKLHLGTGDIRIIIENEAYDFVFEAVEIFLNICRDKIYNYKKILSDMQKAFDLAGSVYQVNDKGEICLRVDKDLAKGLEVTKEILSKIPSAYQTFFDAIGGLFGRKKKAKDIVKDIFVAFEDYLKSMTNVKDYSRALSELQKMGVIVSPQKALLDKIHAYRSDAYAVGHAGKSTEPDEIDGLWFLETVVAQLKLIDRRKDKLIPF